MSHQTVMPTTEQISQTKQVIDAYIQRIDQNPEHRAGAYPYYLFHEAGQPIRGTVMIFHGFSARPHQMSWLAEYLFRNGFNVYQPSIAGHVLTNPAKNWPQVDLRPEYADPLKEKVKRDPVLQNFFANFTNNPGFTRPNRIQQAALVARLMLIEPRLLDIARSIERPNDPDFDRYFVSSHLNYLTSAQKRLAELDAMPGPIYAVGLSVGGAVALALAADRPDRIRRVVAYAPLLKIFGQDRRRYVNLTGPLDIQERGHDRNIPFPVGALTAADRFGTTVVQRPEAIKALQQVPTFLVLTENEDAADIDTSKDFFDKIGGQRNRNHFYMYPAQDLVPHQLVDPTEISQGMSNRFWQSLYQETFRFLTTGEIDARNMNNLEQNADLPTVPPIQ